MVSGRYDRGYVVVFLEENMRPFNSNVLVERLVGITDRSPRTIRNWLRYYRDRMDRGDPDGVVYQRRGREVFYYAEVHRHHVEREHRGTLGRVIPEVKEQQRFLTEKKKELGAAFSPWLRGEVKIHVFRLDMLKGRLHYFEGLSSKCNIERYRVGYLRRNPDKTDLDALYSTWAVYFLDAALLHPDEEIRVVAWEHFDYWRDRREDEGKQAFQSREGSRFM